MAALIYVGWGFLTWYSAVLPWWLVLPLGGWLVAWHGSLQHEAVHGHPTRVPWVNTCVAGLPLALYLPYTEYREQHLTHHCDPRITDPVDDPESFYVAPERWERLGSVARAWFWLQQTTFGRLLLGPPWFVLATMLGAGKAIALGDVRVLRRWLGHGLAVGCVLYWTTHVCGIPIWQYILLYIYPGLSLTLLRSFAEHRPASVPGHRTVLMEANPLWGLLYLNNNLHLVHHRRPGAPWYELPTLFRAERGRWLHDNGGYHLEGYWPVIRRFALRPKESPVHPGFLLEEGR